MKSYEIMLPFGQKDLDELSQVLGVSVPIGEFQRVESDFEESELDELEYVFFDLAKIKISVLFEKSEVYLLVFVKGNGELFTKASEYLYERYKQAGGNLDFQDKPK